MDIHNRPETGRSAANTFGPKMIHQYAILQDKVLGKGTFGFVYEGRDTRNGKRVAVKRISLEQYKNHPQMIIPSLKNEVKNMQILNHKNIVQLYNVFRTENNMYMIMEVCEGGNLDKLIRERSLRSEETIIRVMAQIVEGYLCLRENNIVHRDFKPHNILLQGNTVKIADFGFSKLLPSSSPEMDEATLLSFVGTPLYMSPQILRRLPYSPKTDIWSLGIILYEMAYGKRPWEGKGILNLLEAIEKKPLSFPLIPRMREQTINLIKKMLEDKEEERISQEELFVFFSEESLQRNYGLVGVGIKAQRQGIDGDDDSFLSTGLGSMMSAGVANGITKTSSEERISQELRTESSDSDAMKDESVEQANQAAISELKIEEEVSEGDKGGGGGQQQQQQQQQKQSQEEPVRLSALPSLVDANQQMSSLLSYFNSNLNYAQHLQLAVCLQNLIYRNKGTNVSIAQIKDMMAEQFPNVFQGNQIITDQQTPIQQKQQQEAMAGTAIQQKVEGEGGGGLKQENPPRSGSSIFQNMPFPTAGLVKQSQNQDETEDKNVRQKLHFPTLKFVASQKIPQIMLQQQLFARQQQQLQLEQQKQQQLKQENAD